MGASNGFFKDSGIYSGFRFPSRLQLFVEKAKPFVEKNSDKIGAFFIGAVFSFFKGPAVAASLLKSMGFSSLAFSVGTSFIAATFAYLSVAAVAGLFVYGAGKALKAGIDKVHAHLEEKKRNADIELVVKPLKHNPLEEPINDVVLNNFKFATAKKERDLVLGLLGHGVILVPADPNQEQAVDHLITALDGYVQKVPEEQKLAAMKAEVRWMWKLYQHPQQMLQEERMIAKLSQSSASNTPKGP